MTSENRNKYWAGGFLYNPLTNQVFLHQRDANTKFNPNAWAFFGGLNEPGEAPIDTFIREMEEETGLSVTKEEVTHLYDYMNIELNTYRYVFFVSTDVSKDKLQLGEGAGFDWVSMQELDNYNLTEKTLKDLNYFNEFLKATKSNDRI